MKTVTPTLSISLDCTCPHCDYYIDLLSEYDTDGVAYNDCGNILKDVTPTDGRCWSDVHENFKIDEVICTKCKSNFNVKGVEW